MSFASAFFIHVVSCKSSSVLFIARKYSILGIHSLFIHSSVEHLDCSQLLPISNKATVNVHVQALYTHVLSFLLQKYRGVEWQDCKYGACFTLKELPDCFPKCLWPLHISAFPLFYAQLLSRVQLFVTPWIVARQLPLSLEFSRQEYWSGLPFPSPGDLNPGTEPRCPTL